MPLRLMSALHRLTIRRLICALMALLALSHAAYAQSCSVTSASGAYGSVDVLAGSAVDTSTTFTVTCGGCVLGCTMNVCVQFNQGSSNNSSTRSLSNGANTAQHELYSDAGRTQVWGSWGYGTTSYGTGGVQISLGLPILFGSTSQTLTVYGRFKANQASTVPANPYSWTTSSPSIAYGLGSNCASAPPNNASGGTSTWTATVNANCNLSTTPLNFGTQSLISSNVDAAGAVLVTCTNSTPFSISLDNGANASGAQRRMRLGATANYITYNLYTDASRTSAWTTTTSSTSCTSGAGSCYLGTGTATQASVSVYGRVPTQVAPAIGSYTDTVIVTVTF